jgi:hypothetical protein
MFGSGDVGPLGGRVDIIHRSCEVFSLKSSLSSVSSLLSSLLSQISALKFPSGKAAKKLRTVLARPSAAVRGKPPLPYAVSPLLVDVDDVF